MVITKDEQSPKIEMKINNHVIEQVDQFNYLGSLVTYDGRSEEEIRRRIILSKNAYNKIKKLITNAKISIEIRKRFIKCYVWSVLLFGCETWTIGKEDEQRIQAFEMWLYRRMLKIKWTEKKTNEEVLAMANAEREILKNIKGRQLRFLGHVLRREGMEKTIIEGKLEGRKSRGRPRRNFINEIKKTIKENDIRRIKDLAMDRSIWRNYVANVQVDTARRVGKVIVI